MNEHENPSAFPRYPAHGYNEPHSAEVGGMSLRDYLAAHATDRDVEPFQSWYDGDGLLHHRTRPEARYCYANAMLAARKGA